MGKIARIAASSTDTAAAVLEKVVIGGDLSALKPEERMTYYMKVCESLNLNPLTRPFEYIKLDGKLTLYARKDCTDQLRQIHQVSIIKVESQEIDGLLVTTAHATTADGRQDTDIGVVPLFFPMKVMKWDNTAREMVARSHPRGGERLDAVDLANALMKGATKAKRRVTLSICGLGFLDEIEVEDIVGAERVAMDAPYAPPASIRLTNPVEQPMPPCPLDPQSIPDKVRDYVEDIVARAAAKGAWDTCFKYINDTVLPAVAVGLRDQTAQYATWLLTVGQINAAKAQTS
jgi:hypothetical protein